MAALNRAARPDYAPNAGRVAHPVVNGDTVYPGGLSGIAMATGMLTPWADTIGLRFRGLALDGQTTSKEVEGDGTQVPANQMRVDESGVILRDVTVTGSSAATQHGDPVYCTTDNYMDATLTPTINVGPFARILRWKTGTTCDIQVLTPEQALRADVVHVLEIPCDLATIADGDLVTGLDLPAGAAIIGFQALVLTPATTAAKASTLNLELGTTNLTGGSLALTSANMTPKGAIVSASAITAGNVAQPGDDLSIEAAGTTAFVEGSILLRVLYRVL